MSDRFISLSSFSCYFIIYFVDCVSFRHIEGHSTVFGTGLNYTALRILGVSAEHPIMVNARGTLHKLGESISILLVPH